MRTRLRAQMINPENMEVKGSCQSSQALALYYGLFDEDEKNKAVETLVRFIHNKNDSFDCGFLGMHAIFHVLSEFGESELAFKMITKREYPSYAHLIDIGETTLVESFQPDGNPCGSHNHHFMGDIARWFINRLAGLCVVNSEYVEIKPDFIESLQFANAKCKLPGGVVSVSWHRQDDNIMLDVDCPESIYYTIKLPGDYIMEDGVVRKKV